MTSGNVRAGFAFQILFSLGLVLSRLFPLIFAWKRGKANRRVKYKLTPVLGGIWRFSTSTIAEILRLEALASIKLSSKLMSGCIDVFTLSFHSTWF